jgi:hypothetical protein
MNNLRGNTMRWLHGEPTLEDVLSDPTVHVLMERDDVDPDDLRALLENVRTTLEGRIWGVCLKARLPTGIAKAGDDRAGKDVMPARGIASGHAADRFAAGPVHAKI